MSITVTRYYRDDSSFSRYPTKVPVVSFADMVSSMTYQEKSDYFGPMTRYEPNYVFKSETKDGKTLIVKYNTKGHSGADGELTAEEEYQIGLKINTLSSPNFVQTYAKFECTRPTESNDKWTVCDGDESAEYVVVQYIDGVTLSKFIKTGSFENIVSVVIQTVYALLSAQEAIGFIHNDLHVDNVMVVKSTGPITYSYKGKKRTFNSEYYPVLIDYGKSFIDKTRPVPPVQVFLESVAITAVARIGRNTSLGESLISLARRKVKGFGPNAMKGFNQYLRENPACGELYHKYNSMTKLIDPQTTISDATNANFIGSYLKDPVGGTFEEYLNKLLIGFPGLSGTSS